MIRKNLHLPDDVVRLIGDVLHAARFRSEVQAVIAMLEGASDRLKEVEGYVYLMHGPKGLKIGTSIHPVRRARDLKAKLLYCIPGDRLTELSVHMIWGRYRLSSTGEWFEDRKEIRDWFAGHDMIVPLNEVEGKGLSQYFYPLKLPDDMRRQIEEWRAANADTETGKIPSFSEACRTLIDKGLGND